MTTPFHAGSDGRAGTFLEWLQGQSATLRKSVVDGLAWTPVILEL